MLIQYLIWNIFIFYVLRGSHPGVCPIRIITTSTVAVFPNNWLEHSMFIGFKRVKKCSQSNVSSWIDRRGYKQNRCHTRFCLSLCVFLLSIFFLLTQPVIDRRLRDTPNFALKIPKTFPQKRKTLFVRCLEFLIPFCAGDSVCLKTKTLASANNRWIVSR